MDLTKIGAGYRTYAAAIGLAVLAVVQFRAGDLTGAAQSGMAALAAFGLRSKLGDVLAETLKRLPAAPSVPVQLPAQQTAQPPQPQ